VTYSDHTIDIPFECRHLCWFCGEPPKEDFIFPHRFYADLFNDAYVVHHCPHPLLAVPSCQECYQLAFKAEVDSIWAVKAVVKKGLKRIYKKDLAIGINWTKEELANSQFEGGNFSGFQKSAWFIFEIAKQRVDFNGWPIVVGGMEYSLQ
jgi:hypothetical protein